MLGASSRTASSNLSEYELKRLETVKRNREILAKLGVSQPTIAPRVALPASPKKKAAKAKKVVKPVIETNSDDGGSVASEGGGPRRSRRVSKQVNFLLFCATTVGH